MGAVTTLPPPTRPRIGFQVDRRIRRCVNRRAAELARRAFERFKADLLALVSELPEGSSRDAIELFVAAWEPAQPEG